MKQVSAAARHHGKWGSHQGCLLTCTREMDKIGVGDKKRDRYRERGILTAGPGGPAAPVSPSLPGRPWGTKRERGIEEDVEGDRVEREHRESHSRDCLPPPSPPWGSVLSRSNALIRKDIGRQGTWTITTRFEEFILHGTFFTACMSDLLHGFVLLKGWGT